MNVECLSFVMMFPIINCVELHPTMQMDLEHSLYTPNYNLECVSVSLFSPTNCNNFSHCILVGSFLFQNRSIRYSFLALFLYITIWVIPCEINAKN